MGTPAVSHKNAKRERKRAGVFKYLQRDVATLILLTYKVWK